MLLASLSAPGLGAPWVLPGPWGVGPEGVKGDGMVGPPDRLGGVLADLSGALGSVDAVSSPCLEEMLTTHLWTGVRESAGPSAAHEADHNLRSSPIFRDMGAAELQS